VITTWQSLIVIEGNPHAKMRPRVSRGGRRTHQDPKDAAAEAETRRQLVEQWKTRSLQTGNLTLYATFYRRNRQICDLDNLVKHLLDAAQGVLFVNDAQVTSYQVELDVDPDDPRTEFYLTSHQTNMTRKYRLAPTPG
jgi:Holliday junction resolvase RusA-like endonuclease